MTEEQEKVINKLSKLESYEDGVLHTQLIHPVTFEDFKKMEVFDIHLQDFDSWCREFEFFSRRNCCVNSYLRKENVDLQRSNQDPLREV